jgi:ribosomal-protein-alanine N-acetyltransferase
MLAGDLDEVLATEFRSYGYPWSREIFLDCLRTGYDCSVLERQNELLGHSVMSAAVGEGHLLNICIRRDLQGQGLGRLFVRQVIKRAKLIGAEVLFLEVRPSNIIAGALYESLGFVEVGRRNDYYPADNGREDALVLSLSLDGL